MPNIEVYEIESGRVVSTTDSLDEVANPLPEGLAVREAVAQETPAEPEESDAGIPATPDSPTEAADTDSPAGPAGGEAPGAGETGVSDTDSDGVEEAATETPGPDADGLDSPSD